MASTTKFIEVERHDGGVGLIRLNRPHKLNAWHGAMRDEIIATLQAFDADAGIRAMVDRRGRARLLGRPGPGGSTWLRRGLQRDLDPLLGTLLFGAARPDQAAGDGPERHGGRLGVPGRAAGRRAGRPSRRAHGPAGNQCRHRQRDGAMDHEPDAGHVPHHRTDADRPAHGRGGSLPPGPDPPPGGRRPGAAARAGGRPRTRRQAAGGAAPEQAALPRDVPGFVRGHHGSGDPAAQGVLCQRRTGTHDGSLLPGGATPRRVATRQTERRRRAPCAKARGIAVLHSRLIAMQ